MARLTVGDLNKKVTIEQVMEAFKPEDFIKALELDALIEHWTDKEGLHITPFTRELKATLDDIFEESIQELL